MMYLSRNVLRLCRKQNTIYVNFNHTYTAREAKSNEKSGNNKRFKVLLDENKNKIVFNTYLDHEKLELGYFRYHLKTITRAKKNQKKHFEEKSLPPLPVSLKYYVDNNRLLKEKSIEDSEDTTKSSVFQLPYATSTPIEICDENETLSDRKDVNVPEKEFENTQSLETEEYDRSNMSKWMTNYEHFDDTKLAEDEDGDEIDNKWIEHYGTPDPTSGISNVSCGGCGALLHCSDPGIPGYLPSEIYKSCSNEALKTTECQRCHFLKEYNIALDVTVQAEEYERLLQSIRYVKSLVVLMVDLLDFPCSIWPGIVDVIGKERPIFLVANKVDLLPGDSVGYLKRIKESLMAEVKKTKLGEGNIKYVGLISAKTGYGVEDLISAMFKTWLYKGDVFLVGCTNVGKSSLFNALLQSDYCKVHAVDIVKRATVSRWPGTTLNLLKFPINRPSAWKLQQRRQRLKSEAQLLKVEKEIRNAQVQGKKFTEAPSLIGHIGRTFADYELLQDNILEKRQPVKVLDDKHELFVKSKWLYDTPGVIHPDQVLPLLSTEELLLTVPKKLIRPQTYYLKKGYSFFIGGLARVDLVDCLAPCRFTIFCSECLPITVVKTDDADEVYEKFVGTELFAVPTGDMERLKKWPGLKRGSVLEFTGEGPKLCCGDIVLSSIAWVAVTAKPDTICEIVAWTPEGRGIHKRYPSVLPHSVTLRGKRVIDTPAYKVGKVFVEE
ncbi:nitric oxide-associated protein 1 [Colias croceus]|uniref:nitric oxide-associated protein 1 n=1 Tax=Colias crocea TaxID=72248 RepID=UPI001E27FD16|nr:nitric oxide-associated protein 1 [Colias croceus]